jgi:4-amino-4-deoxy-L-arabinose transferase
MPVPASWRTPVFFAVLALLAFAFQGTRPLSEPDEGRYVDIALQMVDSGDWWVPRLHAHEPHLAKPPLTYWLIAASVTVFGRNEWAVRLPHALAFLITAFLVLDIARSLGLRSPRVAALVWATSLGALVGTAVVSTDAILMTFETAAMAAALRSRTTLMWIAFGLAFLTKGPPGLLPLAALVVFMIVRDRGRSLRTLADPVGISCFLVLGFGWYAAMLARDGALASYFLGYELIDRVATGVHGRNARWWGPLKVYVPTIVLGCLPWIVTLPWARPGNLSPASRRFLWIWIAVPLAVFALSRSRLPLYLLPLFVPMALLIAPRAAALADLHPRRMAVIGSTWVVLVLSLKAVGAQPPDQADAKAMAARTQTIAAGMSMPADEIVFVSVKPVYGLRFYTGLPIERARFDGEPAPDPEPGGQNPSVCEEAREIGQHPLWLVPTGRSARFEQELHACGLTPRLLVGDLGALRAYEVIAQVTAKN